ncbi:hypothetical protein CCH79_00020346 [Gambusia affinis]|uniref:Integrase catalytic domain-containing protein n=1 Tax=Gambusia affinis TaxID=33528 RepID=A0A315VNC0_GAMAF|nr:hypothetical protein CCH79_00020346 [Gambusia affinis]
MPQNEASTSVLTTRTPAPVSVQKNAFPDEYTSLQANQIVHSSSSIVTLDPYMDEGVIEGVKEAASNMLHWTKNPIILPSKHHVSKLLVLHYHTMIVHQGRQFTESAIRQAGLWMQKTGLVCYPPLHNVKETQGKTRDSEDETQYLSSIFACRVKRVRPLVSGYLTHTRRSSKKGVHIEVIESMDTSSCINPIHRFFAIQGTAKKKMRSDRGTNFIAASVELGMTQASKNPLNIVNYLHANGCT